MKLIESLMYSDDHEWVQAEGNTAYVGITDYAQHALGDIVFIELPPAGTLLMKESIFGVVESVKAASDIILPVSGKGIRVNEAVLEDPSIVNRDPYKSWMVCIEMSKPEELDKLMDGPAYKSFCNNLGLEG